MHPRRLVPRFLPSVVAMALLIACNGEDYDGEAARGGGPEALPTPASASLLRRAAGIADAFRTGDTVYIVISDSFPHPVLGVFPDSASADSVADDAGAGFGVLRTSTTSEDGEANAILPGCWKNKYTTEFICPFTLGYQIPQDSVAEVRLVVRTTGGDSLVVTVPGDSAAAFFLTVDAFDKFVVPYYTSVFGVEFVAGMRAGLVSALGELPGRP